MACQILSDRAGVVRPFKAVSPVRRAWLIAPAGPWPDVANTAAVPSAVTAGGAQRNKSCHRNEFSHKDEDNGEERTRNQPPTLALGRRQILGHSMVDGVSEPLLRRSLCQDREEIPHRTTGKSSELGSGCVFNFSSRVIRDLLFRDGPQPGGQSLPHRCQCARFECPNNAGSRHFLPRQQRKCS